MLLKHVSQITFAACFITCLRSIPAQAASLVGVDFIDNSGNTPSNWTAVQGSILAPSFALTDLSDEKGATTPFDLSVELFFNDAPAVEDFSRTPPVNQIPIHTQSLAGIDDQLALVGNTRFTWSELTAGNEYDVFFFGITTVFLTQTVTISAAGTPVSFVQSVLPGFTDDLYINGELGDSSRTLDSYALTFTADANGEIVITTLGQGLFEESFSAGVAIRESAVVSEPFTIFGIIAAGLGGVAMKRKM